MEIFIISHFIDFINSIKTEVYYGNNLYLRCIL